MTGDKRLSLNFGKANVANNSVFDSQSNSSGDFSNTTVTEPSENKSTEVFFNTDKPRLQLGNARKAPRLFGSRITPKCEKKPAIIESPRIRENMPEQIRENAGTMVKFGDKPPERNESQESISTQNDNTGVDNSDLFTDKQVVESSANPFIELPNTQFATHEKSGPISKSYFLLINELEDKCNGLQAKLIDNERLLDVKDSQLAMSKTKLLEIARKTNDLRLIMNKSQESINSLKYDREEYSKTLDTLRNENLSNKHLIKQFKWDITESLKKIETYKSKFNKLKYKFESQNFKISTLNSTIDELSGNLSEEKLKSSALTQRVDELNQIHTAQISQLQSQIEATILEKFNNYLPDLIKSEYNLILGTVLESSDNVKKNFESCFAQLTNFVRNSQDSTNTNSLENFNNLTSQVASIRDEVGNYLIPIKELAKGIDHIPPKLAHLEKDVFLPHFATIRNNNEKSFTDIGKNLSTIKGILDCADSLKREYAEKALKIKLENADLRSEKKGIFDKLVESQSENVKQDKYISTLKIKETESKTKLSNLSECIKNLQGDLRNANSKFENEKKHIQIEAQQDREKYESHIETHNSLNSMAIEEKTRMKNEIDTLYTKNKELQKYRLDFDILQQRYNEVILEKKNSVNDLNKLSEIHKNLLQEKHNQHHNLMDNMNKLQEELASLRNVQQRSKELEKIVKDKDELLAKEMLAMKVEKSKASSLENKIKELETSIKTKLKHFKVEESKYDNKSVALEEKIKKLEKEIKAELNKTTELNKIEQANNRMVQDINMKYLDQLKLNKNITSIQKNTELKLEELEIQLSEYEQRNSSLEIINKELNLKLGEVQPPHNSGKNCPKTSSTNKKRKIILDQQDDIDEFSFDNMNSPPPKASKPPGKKYKSNR